MYKAVLTAWLLTLLFGSCIIGLQAQNLPDKPQPTVKIQFTCKLDVKCQENYGVKANQKFYRQLPVVQPTVDHAYVLSTSTTVLLSIADIENSIYTLNKPGTQEVNWLFGSHPGRVRYYAVILPVDAATTLISYRYKREDEALKAAGYPGHKIVKWWLPTTMMSAAHIVGILVTVTSTGR
jgi:hypothetical protein